MPKRKAETQLGRDDQDQNTAGSAACAVAQALSTAAASIAASAIDSGRLREDDVHPAVSLLVRTLRTGDSSAVATRALDCLSQAYSYEPTNHPGGFAGCLVACGGIPELVALLAAEDEQVVINACRCLTRLMFPGGQRREIAELVVAEHGTLPVALGMLHGPAHIVSDAAAFFLGLLGALSYPQELCTQIVEGGAVTCVLRAMAAGFLQEGGPYVIATLMRGGPGIVKMLVEIEGVVDALVRGASSGINIRACFNGLELAAAMGADGARWVADADRALATLAHGLGAQSAVRNHARRALRHIHSRLGAGYSTRVATAVAEAMLVAGDDPRDRMRGFLREDLSICDLAIDALESAARNAADLRKEMEELRAVPVNTRAALIDLAETVVTQHQKKQQQQGQRRRQGHEVQEAGEQEAHHHHQHEQQQEQQQQPMQMRQGQRRQQFERRCKQQRGHL